ncbi:ATP-binding protein [Mahella sp.]|uniref:Lon protease family protein n=1 Tax=Mahella sp. TaxID=2798721 RepID=UPI0025BD810F|nr:ATP-binding protein [Mahella sp.]MBZ4665548.1 peptidase lon-like protein [Mahella sp.]
MEELTYRQLKKECDPNAFNFDTTEEIEPLDGIIGQDRAVKAMEFGLKIKIRGYNIYMSGLSGTGKTSYAQWYAEKIASQQDVPDDWCYVYNFDDPEKPLALNLPAGMGRMFRNDMEELINILEEEIPKLFSGDEYEKESNSIFKQLQDQKNELLMQLDQQAAEQDFQVKTSGSSIYFAPIIDGNVVEEDDYNKLDEETKRRLNEKSSQIQVKAMEIMRKVRNLEKEARAKTSELDNRIALLAVGMHIDGFKQKYADYPKVVSYLEAVKNDILLNIDDFKEQDDGDDEALPLGFLYNKRSGLDTDKYKVNVLVDNTDSMGAPVVVEFNPTQGNLIGQIEYENEFGSFSTDFSMIKAGSLLKANGGYIILQAKDLLANWEAWEALKRVLKMRALTIESNDRGSLSPAVSIKPQPIPIDVKVILIGSNYIYETLYEFDEDFAKLFKIKADFDDEMDRTPENEYKLAQFISSFCSREKIKPFDRSGVARVIEYASRLVEDQTKLSTRFNDIVEILAEAGTWAEIDGSNIVDARYVDKAIEQKEYRSNRYDERIDEAMVDGTIMIDVDGWRIGQINGLSILNVSDYEFGKPSRITATTYMGESGIVNIEREIEMSGTSHSKGVLILSGYIGEKYAQDIPLALTANLCFEQLYSGIDGDSASSTELYAILSSLAGVPIYQGLAVTGSVNQKGEIQPVGGISMKIEGFFDICRKRGLTGRQGVIIPAQNVKNLTLKDDIIEAVKNGLFHIYAISSIDEGIELLTGIPAGQKQADGSYPDGTINAMVYNKLKYYAETMANVGKHRDADR